MWNLVFSYGQTNVKERDIITELLLDITVVVVTQIRSCVHFSNKLCGYAFESSAAVCMTGGD